MTTQLDPTVPQDPHTGGVAVTPAPGAEIENTDTTVLKREFREQAKKQLASIAHEFTHGVDFLNRHKKSVTILGSARFQEEDSNYQNARHLAARIAKELGYAIVTGGGPGIMEAGNRGAREVQGASLGITIRLPMEQRTNEYVTDEAGFSSFFSRKMILYYAAEAYVYFPGGYGTLDELFEILTLIQTGKIDRVPVVLFGSDFWKPLDAFIKNTLFDKYRTISEEDIPLYTITDDENVVLEIVKNAPVR